MHFKTAVNVAIALVGAGAAMQAAAQSKVELWGIVDAGIRHTTNEGPGKSNLTKMMGGGMSQSRWGLNIEEDLGQGSKALAHLEHRFNTDTGDKDSASTPYFQLAHVGLQGPYGRLTMGRQWNVLFDVVSSTYASFPYSPYMDAYKPELGMAAGARTSNVLKYTLATPSRNWVGTVQYSFAEGNKTSAIESGALAAAGAAQAAAMPEGMRRGTAAAAAAIAAGNPAGATAAATRATTEYVTGQVQQAVGAYAGANVPGVAGGALKTMGGFLRYSEKGVSVGGGFLRTALPGGSDLDAWTFGGSYRSGPLYFNMGYGQNRIKIDRAAAGDIAATIRNATDLGIVNQMWQGQTNGGFQAGDADKRSMVKVGFGYQITPRVNGGVHYYHAKQSGSVGGASNGKANFVVAAVDYAFSKRTDAYFAVDHTRVSGGSAVVIDPTNGTRTRTGITTGLRHRF